MVEEFNLSEKRRNSNITLENKPIAMYMEYDVKEFIKLLKANIKSKYGTYKSTKITLECIDKLAGDKLI